MTPPPFDPADPIGIDDLLTDDEKAIRDAVRTRCDAVIAPNIAEWFESGRIPVREIAKEFGELGVLGMHLTGYGCADLSAVDYGLACLGLEAADSGRHARFSVRTASRWNTRSSGTP